MTIEKMTNAITELEKVHGVSIYVGYDTDTRSFEFGMYKKNARLIRRFSVEEIVNWAIEDFEAQLERMADEICTAIELRGKSKTCEVVE